jgi:hypothetical protein
MIPSANPTNKFRIKSKVTIHLTECPLKCTHVLTSICPIADLFHIMRINKLNIANIACGTRLSTSIKHSFFITPSVTLKAFSLLPQKPIMIIVLF